MPNREEIREGIEKLFDEYDTEGDLVSLLLNYLHSQGVVIKVAPPDIGVNGLDSATQNMILAKAGYVAVESLIKE